MRTLAVPALAVSATIVLASTLSPADAAGSDPVTFQLSHTSIRQGDHVDVRGTAGAAAKGSTLRIQFYDVDQGGNRWRTVATATARSGGAYAETITPRDGSTKYRVYRPSAAGRPGAASRTVLIRAYAWYRMGAPTEVEVRSGANHTSQHGPVTVAGGAPITRYWSTDEDAAGSTSWITLGSCKRLKGRVGLDDRSADGAVAQFRAYEDEHRVVSLRARKGSTATFDAPIDLTGTRLVRFRAEALSAERPVFVTAFDLRLFCAFPEND